MRSSGFKMTRNLHNLIRILGVTDTVLSNLSWTEAQVIAEIRSICSKYQPLPSIDSDLTEIQLMEQQNSSDSYHDDNAIVIATEPE
jgi:hypothetical protein